MKILFLTYINRSGSTYLSQLLSCSEEVCVCPEADSLVQVLLENPSRELDEHYDLQCRLEQMIHNDSKLMNWGLDELCVAKIATSRTYLDVFCELLKCYRDMTKQNAQVIVFKAERLIHLLPLIKNTKILGTEIQFIALIRDPRAIICSQKRTTIPETLDPMTSNIGFTAMQWTRYCKRSYLYQNTHNLHLLHYEDLLTNTENEIWKITEKLKVKKFPISPELGDLYNRMSNTHKLIHPNITMPPILDKINGWENHLSINEIKLIEYITAKGMARANYERTELIRTHIVIRLKVVWIYLTYHMPIIFRKIKYKFSYYNLKSGYSAILSFARNVAYFVLGYIGRKRYKHIKTYCMFIGYPRSGHSIIGAMLDAHADACISMELDVLKLIKRNYNKYQIYYNIFRNSHLFTKVLKNKWTGYSYAVPGQFQGRTKQPLVIGDKKGSRSTLRIGRDISLIERLGTIINIQIKIIHVIRHPLDNITTMITSHLGATQKPVRLDFERRIFNYFRNATINRDLLQKKDLEILVIYHEDLIKNTKNELLRIINFLGLKPDSEYIDACASIVYKEPHRSRDKVEWPDDLKKSVFQKMKEYKTLHRYLYNDR